MGYRFKWVLCISILFLCSVSSVLAQAGDEKEAGAQVRSLERKWLDAYEQHDTKAMTEILADNFLITFPDGSQQTKQQILEMIKRPVNPASATRFRTEGVTARVYGDTVILTGRVVGEFTRDGKPQADWSTYTDTYIKRNGRWQVVASHLSNVPQAPKTN